MYIMLLATRGALKEKVFLEISQNLQENTCARVSFLMKLQVCGPATFIKKETFAQVFSCEFLEISKNNFFAEHLRATASMLLFLFCLKKEEEVFFFFRV